MTSKSMNKIHASQKKRRSIKTIYKNNNDYMENNDHIEPENDLVKALRDLREQIEKSQKIADERVNALFFANIREMSPRISEDQIQHMIATYPEVWGKGGTMRPWLERWASEHGIDGDFGLPSDQGPFNSSNL